ncbi:MAG TPA: methyltransferase domain-containing protein [Thermoanaerobaculia bacterium]|nr:methyltransferase domain-containing protein [Thermoanaerobaculia bacterium]
MLRGPSNLMPSNAWYHVRYAFIAPFYDRITKFHSERRRSVELLGLQPVERVLIIGCGTGADIPFLPRNVEVLATDLTASMLRQARAHARPGVEFRQMDGMALDLPDASYDAAILHMVLEVIPDPVRCLREAARVLRPGGRLAVFDKFLPDDFHPSLPRRAALALLDVFFTSTNRRMAEILEQSGAPFEVAHDEPAVSSYRHLVLRRL